MPPADEGGLASATGSPAACHASRSFAGELRKSARRAREHALGDGPHAIRCPCPCCASRIVAAAGRGDPRAAKCIFRRAVAAGRGKPGVHLASDEAATSGNRRGRKDPRARRPRCDRDVARAGWASPLGGGERRDRVLRGGRCAGRARCRRRARSDRGPCEESAPQCQREDSAASTLRTASRSFSAGILRRGAIHSTAISVLANIFIRV